tara:strand:+ start:27 stop:323 length:297 start_codon:yes stop_codon:yes gene_type:complete
VPLNNIKAYFKMVAILEGVSYILLLFVAVPLKYWVGDEQYVQMLGMPHGLLFVAYLVLAYLLKNTEKWSSKDFIIIMLASILPFGTLYVDWKYIGSLS